MKLAIIPARGGSKRIKNKNILPFMGKPMISYALEAAAKTGLFDKIHVSTDSEEIRQVVEELGYSVDFLRPNHLADDMTGLLPVLKWVLSEYQKQGMNFEDICCLMPAAPLLEAEDLIAGYELYQTNNKYHPLMVVTSFPVPIEWAFHRDHKTLLTPNEVTSLEKRSQDIEDTFYESGPFLFFHSSHILEDISLHERKFLSYLISRDKAVDIDNQEDLDFAETLYLGRSIKAGRTNARIES
jgi:pseudaminic acid cytidylyltransferase